jgi:hypothetical protein
MKRVLIPPHVDFTVERTAPLGFVAFDFGRAFAERVQKRSTLEEACSALEAGPFTRPRMERLLLLRAALQLGTPEAPVHRRLRALGAAFRGLCGDGGRVRLRADDLELQDGTTERSEDVLAAAHAELPFRDELELAVDFGSRSNVVRVWLAQDQQLPAAVYIAERLPPRTELQLFGPFALLHRRALARLKPFSRAEFVLEEGLTEHVTSFPGEPPPPEKLRWWPAVPRSGDAPWGGPCSLQQLLQPERLLRTSCKVAIVRFCAIGDEVIDNHGGRCPTSSLFEALETLRAEGTQVVGEWWVGAPGVNGAALEETLQWLTHHFPFTSLAGVRPFHWPITRPVGTFAGTPVRESAPDPSRDLVRSRVIQADETPSAQELHTLVDQLAARTARLWPLAPGRLALAYVSAPPPRPEAGDALLLDGDCAVVCLPASLEGKVGPAWYAANLATGDILAVDARIAPALERMRAAAAPTDVFAQVPANKRAQVVEALVKKNVLTQVRA